MMLQPISASSIEKEDLYVNTSSNQMDEGTLYGDPRETKSFLGDEENDEQLLSADNADEEFKFPHRDEPLFQQTLYNKSQ